MQNALKIKRKCHSSTQNLPFQWPKEHKWALDIQWNYGNMIGEVLASDIMIPRLRSKVFSFVIL